MNPVRLGRSWACRVRVGSRVAACRARAVMGALTQYRSGVVTRWCSWRAICAAPAATLGAARRDPLASGQGHRQVEPGALAGQPVRQLAAHLGQVPRCGRRVRLGDPARGRRRGRAAARGRGLPAPGCRGGGSGPVPPCLVPAGHDAASRRGDSPANPPGLRAVPGGLLDGVGAVLVDADRGEGAAQGGEPGGGDGEGGLADDDHVADRQ